MARKDYSEREVSSLNLWIQLVKCSNSLERYIDDKFRQTYGQTMSRFDVLSQLDRVPDGKLKVGDLAKKLLASKGNITGLIDRMTKDGLVIRQRRADDRRSYVISITDKGRDLFERMSTDHACWVAERLSELDINSMQRLTAELKDAIHSIKDQ